MKAFDEGQKNDNTAFSAGISLSSCFFGFNDWQNWSHQSYCDVTASLCTVCSSFQHHSNAKHSLNHKDTCSMRRNTELQLTSISAKWQTFCVFVCPCHIHSLALKECWWTRKQVKMPAKALGCCKLMHNYFMLFFPTCYWYQSQGKELPRQWQTQKVLTLFNTMSASTSIAGFQPAQIWKLVISLWGLKNKSRLKAGSHIKVGWIPAGTLQLPAQI